MAILDEITRSAGRGLSDILNACIEKIGSAINAGIDKVTDGVTAGVSAAREGIAGVANQFTLGGGTEGPDMAAAAPEPALGLNGRKQQQLAQMEPDRSEFAASFDNIIAPSTLNLAGVSQGAGIRQA